MKKGGKEGKKGRKKGKKGVENMCKPAGKESRPRVKRMAAKDWKLPHTVNTEQHRQLRQQGVSSESSTVRTYGAAGLRGSSKVRGEQQG